MSDKYWVYRPTATAENLPQSQIRKRAMEASFQRSLALVPYLEDGA